jgi:hypothetical protein
MPGAEVKIAIYTSFAVNYLAKARVMANTVRAHNPDIDVVALVADRFPGDITQEDEPFAHIWMVEDYPTENIRSWIFGHNIMELATAIKGWALQRLLALGYDYVMYLDPDCWVLSDPAQIVGILPEGKSVAVVPHTTHPADTDEEIRLIETSSLKHGIYNLGFLLVKNDENGNKLADWWAARLKRYCIDDFEHGLFTDQRWFDLAVGYFNFIEVSRHAGIDVASWNVGQRTVLRRPGGGYTIDGDPLIFYHFSGVGPAGVHRWVREKFAPADPLVAELEFEYERLIEEQGQSSLVKIKPFFDTYPDGRVVKQADRRLHRLRADIAERFPDPYDIRSQDNFRAAAIAAERPSETLHDVLTERSARSISRPGNEEAQRLFDPAHYRLSMDVPLIEENELWAHYLAQAWDATIRPNRYFDPIGYAPHVTNDERTVYPTPLHHYLGKGLGQGISPSWIYDDAWYLLHNPDVHDAVRAGALLCGFEHFVRFGAREGRSSCAFFNEHAYLDHHPDVADAVANGYFSSGEEHYMLHGCAENRLV